VPRAFAIHTYHQGFYYVIKVDINVSASMSTDSLGIKRRTNVMRAREAANSSPPVDTVTTTAQSVRNSALQLVVERAQNQLQQLTLQRQEIAQRITIIKRTINGLVLLGGSELPRRPEEGTAKRARGITNACRVVLNRTDTSLSANEIYAIVQAEFPELFLHTRNHYASLVTTLNTLVTYGEARTFLRNRSRFWQRLLPVESRSPGFPGT
jgi:hypothetical protein